MKLTFVIAACAVLVATHAVATDGGAQCATIEDNADRLACYDGIFRNQSVDTKEPAPETSAAVSTAPTAPTPPPPQADPEEQFGREQIERQQPIEEREEIAEISSDVTNIKRRARNELIVYLANGQIWAQTSPRYLTIKDGDSVVVRRGRMGGYILTTERGGSTRVKRLR